MCVPGRKNSILLKFNELIAVVVARGHEVSKFCGLFEKGADGVLRTSAEGNYELRILNYEV